MIDFTRGDKVLIGRKRKPYTVTTVNADGTLNAIRKGREPSATRRTYRGIGNDGTEIARNVDPATVTRFTRLPLPYQGKCE